MLTPHDKGASATVSCSARPVAGRVRPGLVPRRRVDFAEGLVGGRVHSAAPGNTRYLSTSVFPDAGKKRERMSAPLAEGVRQQLGGGKREQEGHADSSRRHAAFAGVRGTRCSRVGKSVGESGVSSFNATSSRDRCHQRGMKLTGFHEATVVKGMSSSSDSFLAPPRRSMI